jgi:hypothetical protein
MTAPGRLITSTKATTTTHFTKIPNRRRHPFATDLSQKNPKP